MVSGQDGKQMCNEPKLKVKMITEVCHHFILDSTFNLFDDHEDGNNESVIEDDHTTKLIKCTAHKFFTLTRVLRPFTFSKKLTEEIVQLGQLSDRRNFNEIV